MYNFDVFLQCLFGFGYLTLVFYLILEISLAISAKVKKGQPESTKPQKMNRNILIILLVMGGWSILLSIYLNYRANSMPDLIRKLETEQREDAINLLGDMGNPVIEPLMDVYQNSSSDQMKAGVVATISQIRDADAVEALGNLLLNEGYENIYLRIAAAQALGGIANKKAIKPLITALNDPVPDVRIAAVISLAQTKDESAVESLIAALQDADLPVREAAVKGILWIDHSRIIEVLIGALNDESATVRVTAAKALVAGGDERAVGPLLDAIRTRDLPVIASSPDFYIPRANTGDEMVLIDALNYYGSSETATIYLNCGNEELAQAAAAWSKTNGYEIVPSLHYSGPIWRSK